MIRRGAPGGWRQLIRAARRRATGEAGAGVAWALAAVALLSAFVATAGPRAVTASATTALRSALTGLPALDRGIAVTGQWQAAQEVSPTALSQFGALVAAVMHPPLISPAAASWNGLTTPTQPVGNPARSAVLGGQPAMETAYRSDLAASVRVVAGTLPNIVTAATPAGPAGHRAGRAGGGPRRTAAELVFAAAVTPATAARFGLHPGSMMNLAGFRLRITAVVAPRHPTSVFWQFDPLVAQPQLMGPPTARVWVGGAFVGPAEAPALQVAMGGQTIQGTWFFPIDLGAMTPPQLPSLLAAVNGVVSSGGGPATGLLNLQAPPTITSGLAGVLAGFTASQQAARAIDSLIVGGLFAAALILLLVCSLMAAGAYAGELSLLRSRGGAALQVAWRVLARTSLVTGPGLAAGFAMAVVAEPAGGDSVAWQLGGLAALFAVGAPVVICAWRHRRPAATANQGREEVIARRRSPRRVVAETTLIVAAGGAVVGLRLRGVPAGGDPYLSASPLLVAVAVTLLLARLYPVPVRSLLRIASARPGPVAFLGLARAGRARLGAILPALALVLPLTLAAFCAMVLGSVGAGQAAVSWQQVGADVTVRAPGDTAIHAAAVRALAAVPGVRQVTAVYTASSTGPFAGALDIPGHLDQTVGLVVAGPRSYAALAAGTPWPRFPAGLLARGRTSASGVVPVLTSTDTGLTGPPPRLLRRNRAAALELDGLRTPVAVAGIIGDTPAMPSGGAFIVLPQWAAARLPSIPGPDVLLALATGGSIDLRAFRAVSARVIPGGQLTARSQVLAALRGSPAQAAAEHLYTLGIWAAAALAAVAVAFGIAATARARAQLAERMSALGMAARQARALALTGALPLLAVGVLGMALAGWLLALLIGPVLNLSVFTGSAGQLAVRPDLASMVYLAAGATAAALAITAVEGALSVRRDVAAALRQEEAR